jgi:hypothetical protein
MLGDVFMPNLKDAPPEEVAMRMRDVAAGLSNPADIQAAEAYARELERKAERDRRALRTRIEWLNQTAADIGRRMRGLAQGVSEPSDAQHFGRYTDWFDEAGDVVQVQAEEPARPDTKDRTGGHRAPRRSTPRT